MFQHNMAPVISLCFLMDFMMQKMIGVMLSSILLMNSRLLNVSKLLVPETSLARRFDFLCISLMMKVQSRSEVPCYISITCYWISVPSKGFVLHLEARGVKQCRCNEALLCTCQSLSKPELLVLFGGRRAKEGKDALFFGVGKETCQRSRDPASPFS